LRVELLEDRRVMAAANLVISEFMATNVTKLADVAGEYHDWIEIRNLGSTSVNLVDYALTDNDSDLQKWSFPSTTLAAGGYLIVFASQPLDANGLPIDNYIDSAGRRHTNFKLDSEGEYLGLTYQDPVTQAVSVVHEYADFPEQYPDYSYGIASDSQVRYFSATTPGAVNGVGLSGVVADTKFSVDRGFFNAPFSLTISTETVGATIRYTTDGSAPSATTGTVYSGPITIDKTSVVRAIAYRSGYVPTNVDTQTYLFLHDVVNQTHQQAIDQGFPVNWREPPDGSLVVAEHGMDPEVIGTFTGGVPNGNDNYGGIYASEIFDSLTSIPTISIVMDMDDLFDPATGIYANSTERGSEWERAASFEWITPGSEPEVQVDAGIRIQGGAFRSDFFSEKHSFRLLFKDEYGPGEFVFPLFGDDATSTFETVVLRTSTNDGYAWRAQPLTRQYTRDEFGRSLQLDMGAPSPRNTYAHLYINGTYWGVYSPTERPDAEFAASYLGYNPDNTDVIHDNEANSGDFVAWDTMISIASTATTSLDNYMKIQGRAASGADDPARPAYLDVENYIDYLLINAWGGNDDWPHHNFWAARDQDPITSEGFQFFIWDFEGTMGNTREWSPLDALTFNQGWNDPRTADENNAGRMHHFLKSNPEYRLDFADQVHKYFFNDGIFEPANLLARYEEIADRVRPYIVAESARWGDMHATVPLTLAEWDAEYAWMVGTYLPQRSSYVMQELLDYGLYPSVVAPSFSQHGGQVAAGYDLTIAAPAGTIYYTTDGSDPRLVGGALNPAAQVFTGAAIDIASAKTVKARVRSGTTWSALNEADFTVTAPASAATLAITELNYNPHDANPGLGESNVDAQEFEFVELRNIGNETIDLTGVAFSEVAVSGEQQGIEFTFGARTLAPGEHVLVVENLAAFQSRYGTMLNVAGEYSGKLANGGETVTLKAASGAVIASFAFDDGNGWPTAADGNGKSLEVISVAGDYNSASNWRASSALGGSPGAVGGVPSGDFDGDNLVNGADFLIWQRNLGKPAATRADGDSDFDNDVDAQDLAVWRGMFGQPAVEALTTSSVTTMFATALTPAIVAPTTGELVDIALAVAQMDEEAIEGDEAPLPVVELPAALPTKLRGAVDSAVIASPASMTLADDLSDDESAAGADFTPWDGALDDAFAELI
jgi:hypothetical protein